MSHQPCDRHRKARCGRPAIRCQPLGIMAWPGTRQVGIFRDPPGGVPARPATAGSRGQVRTARGNRWRVGERAGEVATLPAVRSVEAAASHGLWRHCTGRTNRGVFRAYRNRLRFGVAGSFRTCRWDRMQASRQRRTELPWAGRAAPLHRVAGRHASQSPCIVDSKRRAVGGSWWVANGKWGVCWERGLPEGHCSLLPQTGT
jgi:hypothetical protein